MDSEDVSIFCQNELPSKSFLAFEDMRKKEELCDLTFKLQDRTVPVHSVIVAAGIPYFRKMVTKSAIEKEEMQAALEVLDPTAIESLIQFVYTSKVTISYENAQSLLTASQFLELGQVEDACVDFLSKRVCLDNVGQTLTFASNLKNIKLVESCSCYIRNNFTEFTKSADFFSLSLSCLKALISGGYLNVQSEEIVSESIMKWTEHLYSERHDMLPELLKQVRLPVKYLVEHAESEELIRNTHPCRDTVNGVQNKHLLSSKNEAFLNLNAQPRNISNPNLLFVVSCCDDSGFSVNNFDSSTATWNILARENSSYANTAAAVNDKIYIFHNDKIQTFCLRTHELHVLQNSPTYSKRSAIVAYGNIIYSFGSNYSFFSNTMRRFDAEKNKWLPNEVMKTYRIGSGACVLSESIYVTGGFDKGAIDTVEKYDPSTGDWCYIAPMIAPREQHGCASVMGRMYVFGGYNSDDFLNTAEAYDPLVDQWKIIASMKTKMSLRACVSYNNKIYAFQSTCAEIYDPERDEWKSGFTVPGDVDAAVSIPRTTN